MEATTFDPYALDFTYKTPSPSVNAVHSYVTITSCNTSYESCSLLSTSDEAGNVTLTTDNVRGLTLKGEELIARGVDILTWNGVDVTVTAEDIALGEQSGKTPEVYGPFNQVFERPFCLIYPDSGPEAYKDYAAFLLTAWSIQGNGAGCSMPLSRVTDALRAERNMVYLGVPKSEIPAAASLPISWDTNTLTIKDETHSAAAMLFVFPEGERLAAAMVATVTFEYLLFWHQPFSSRAVMPDYFMWTANNGGVVAGMAGPDWTF
jgi:hypothetical protein